MLLPRDTEEECLPVLRAGSTGPQPRVAHLVRCGETPPAPLPGAFLYRLPRGHALSASAMRGLLILPLLLLAACNRPAEEPGEGQDRDPMIAAAVNQPLLADPDLTGINMGGAALTGGGPATAPIPPDKRGKDEVDAAKEAALILAGGRLEAVPSAAAIKDVSRLAKAVTAPAIAAALGVGTPVCTASLDYSAIWAARLAAPFEVYPRGHTGQSAGSDAAGCKLRVVGFATPVSRDDVLAFYATRAKSAGYPLARSDEDRDVILSGARGAARYAVAVRERDGGMTDVVVVTAGL